MSPPRTTIVFTIEEHGAGYYGGAFKDLLTILARLDRDRFLPVVLLTGSQSVRQVFEALGVQVLACPLPPWRKGRSYPLVPAALLRLLRIMVQAKVALVHVNGGYNDVPYISLAARLLRIPSVFTVRDLDVLKEKSRKYHFRWVNQLLLCSKVMEREVIRQRLVGPARMRTIHAGIDVEAFQGTGRPDGAVDVRRTFGIPPDAPVVGVVANLSPIKGYEDLIAALGLLAPKVEGLRCICVGGSDPAYRGTLERLVESHGLGRCVVFVGYQQVVLPFYEAMDVLVLPSRSEAFPLVLLEAMALAKPVVATDVGGIPEAVVNGVTGLLVPPGQPSRLADAILCLIEDRSTRLRMGMAGYARVRQHFTIKAQMGALESLYAELIDGKTRQVRAPQRRCAGP